MDMDYQHSFFQPSLLMLNDDELLQLFKYLEQNDALSLAGTCRRLQELAYRKFNSITIYPILSDEDHDLCISILFSTIGHHIKNLTLKFDRMSHRKPFELDFSEHRLKHLFASISKNCNSLESLTIRNLQVYHKKLYPNDRLADSINVKSLYFDGCDLDNGNKLFRILRNVESLEVKNDLTGTSDIDFGKFFRNNMEIKLFVWNTRLIFDDIKLFKVMSKLEKLCINVEKISKCSSLNPLTNLNSLKHLEIARMNGLNVNHFLEQMAVKQFLEKASFSIIEVNETTLQILRKFLKLTELTLFGSPTVEVNSNTTWPQHLQSLRLIQANITMNGFIAAIQNLRSLKTFDLSNSHTNYDDKIVFYDTTQLNRKILEAMDFAKNFGKLEVSLDLNVFEQLLSFYKMVR